MRSGALFLAFFVLCGAAAAAELRPGDGRMAPPLALEDLAGKTHRLADYRGKVVLVNFWATWCEPCRAEMPSMDKLRAAHVGKLEVLAVNLAEPKSRVEKYAKTVPLGFPLLLDTDSTASKTWKAKLLPASYLVDRGGRVRYVAFGEVDWTSEAVRKAVGELLR